MRPYKVVQFRDCASLDFCLNSSLKNTVEKCVNVRLFGEVVESLGFF